MLQNQAPAGVITTTPQNRTSLKKFCITIYNGFKKQPLELFGKKKCYWQIEKFHTKTPVLEFLFNEVAGLKACNLI